MSITGLPGQGPVRVGIPIDDLTAGNLLALGCMMALFDRERTGVGRWVTTSLLEAQIFMLDFQASRWLIAKEVAGQAGNDHPTGIPTGVFPTSDGHINIAASSSRVFARFCEAIGQAGLEARSRNGRPRTAAASTARTINAAIGEITRTKPSEHWIELLEAQRHPVRADLLDRPGVRRSAGASISAWRRKMHSPYVGRSGGGCLGDQHLRLLQGDPRTTRRTPGEHGRNPEVGRLHRRARLPRCARRESI